MVYWFGPENHVGFGLSVAPKKQREEVDAGHGSRFSGLFRVVVSQVRVFQFTSKPAEARRWVVHVT
jgi:hypothetical protein